MRRINHNQMLYEHEIQYKMYKVCKKQPSRPCILYVLPRFFSIFTLKRPLFLTDGVYIALAAAVPIGHRFKIHLFWTTKINDGPFISGSDFFHANYFFGKKHIYFLATDLDRRGILWPPYVCSKQPNRFR